MEKKFAILTDSGCDMPQSFLEEHDVAYVRMGFTMDGKSYEGEDGERIDDHDFYERLRQGAMPTTYQITGETARGHLEKFVREGKDVLAIIFSSSLSGTAGSFVVAARDLQRKYPDRKIVVVDSLCASMGEGMLVYYALQKAESGASIEETAAYLEGLKGHICHQFTVDNLFHLKRGGRVSSATAIVGTILKIKPIMHMDDDGKLVAVGKTIGRKKSLQALVERTVATATIEKGEPIFIGHGDCMEDVEYVKALVEEKFPDAPITVHHIGSVIGAHSGCGTLAIFYRGSQR